MHQPPNENAEPFIGPLPYQPDDAIRYRVRRLSKIGMRYSDIAILVGICRTTLRTYYQTELLEGAAEGKEQVMETLYGMATDGKHQAATIFSAKTRCNIMESPDDDTPPAGEEKTLDPPPAGGSLLDKFNAVVEANGHYVFPHQRAAAEAQPPFPEPLETDPQPESKSETDSEALATGHSVPRHPSNSGHS